MSKISSLVCRCANKIVRHTKWYKAIWNGTTKFWPKLPFNMDVVNLGGGVGLHAFNYDDISLKAMNWAIDSQTLEYDYIVLKNHSSYLRDGATVLVPLFPFSGLCVPNNKDNNLKYYLILHSATVLNFDNDERTKSFKMRSNPFAYYPFMCIKKTCQEIICFPGQMFKKIGKRGGVQSLQQIRLLIA